MFGKKKHENKNVAGKVALVSAATAAAGYVAGVLTAPKSGKETRGDIKNKANETYLQAEKELKKLHTELNTALAEATDAVANLRGKTQKNLDEAMTRGKSAKEKAREILSGLHDGEVDDKDLKKAVSEATKAIENLRNYLKK